MEVGEYRDLPVCSQHLLVNIYMILENIGVNILISFTRPCLLLMLFDIEKIWILSQMLQLQVEDAFYNLYLAYR